MKKKITTGLFFGSFNPIHIGHLAIANYMAEFTDLNEVWMVVSPQNPLKERKNLLNDYHRYEMVYRAAEGYQKLSVSKIEFDLPKPSYTSVTLAYLEDKYPSRRFALIIGGDNLENFHKWLNHEVIIDNYPIYVFPRPKSGESAFDKHPNVHITEAPQMEISSSFIRKSIKDGKNVRAFVPAGANEYLNEMNFYK